MKTVLAMNINYEYQIYIRMSYQKQLHHSVAICWYQASPLPDQKLRTILSEVNFEKQVFLSDGEKLSIILDPSIITKQCVKHIQHIHIGARWHSSGMRCRLKSLQTERIFFLPAVMQEFCYRLHYFRVICPSGIIVYVCFISF